MRVFASIAICSLFVAFAETASAHSEGTGKGGFFGDVRIGGAVVSSRPSGLEVFGADETLNSLAARRSRQSEGIAMIGGKLGYDFTHSGTTIFAGGGIEDPLYLTIAQKAPGLGSLTLSALYEKKEVWQDPYSTGLKRAKTDAESVGYSVNWEDFLETGMRLFFDQKYIDVEQDRIGQSQPDLRRDGTDTSLGIGYSFNWGAAGVFSPTIRHIRIERDGASNSGCGYAAGLKHVLVLGSFSFATSLDISDINYQKLHSVFNQKREETAYGISETISVAEPFGLKNSFLFGVAACGKTDSKINFFDSSSVALGAGIGYKF